ncbi:MAG TPA: hypothetical protein VL485_20065 [Ktedonobacteraceae bacterium]|nr:hypothetical protein [Ktedonobacteraceae bacterium]
MPGNSRDKADSAGGETREERGAFTADLRGRKKQGPERVIASVAIIA